MRAFCAVMSKCFSGGSFIVCITRSTEEGQVRCAAGHPLHPTVPVRRVANVVWRGVRLSEVLKQACVSPAARFVWSYGADGGDYHGIDIPAYIKDMPVSELHGGEAMLCGRHHRQGLSQCADAFRQQLP
ncbi:molybdopterin-dependent oxidoreductase [Variovorax sp. LjRoot130]|uniref:molybdopterin-dependent oxidoreductase n=1 Tax=Variovorax sp. LjRoot130 TaxID=3342261 RepID=UPI003F519879